jgi:hypothetical protein
MVAVYSVLPARLPVGVNVAVVPVAFTVPVTAAPLVFASVKLAVVSVELVIGSEKVADTEEFSVTPVALFAGEVKDTVGGVVSGTGPVVKCQMKLATSALPAASFAVVVMVAVYSVLPARLPVGVNVAVVPVTFTVPVTGVPPLVVASVKLAVVSVELSIGSEKVADTEEFSVTPVALFAGDVEDTIGGVVSGAGPVVNCQL